MMSFRLSRFLIFAAVLMTAAIFSFCSRQGADPVVILAYPSADTLDAGGKVEFLIRTFTIEGEISDVSISSFNEEQGRLQETVLHVGASSWKGTWVGNTPSITADTLRHVVSFHSKNTLGQENDWDCPLVLCKPKQAQ